MKEFSKDQMHAIERALITYTNSRERWQALAAAGAMDQQVIEEINYNFGLGGSSSGPDWIPESHQANPPRIWFSVIQKGRPDLQGAELVAVTRYLFQIGPPGQMRLFNW